MKRTLIAALFTVLPVTAWAGCNPTAVLDGAGVSTNVKTSLDGSSNCFGYSGMVDGTGALAFPSVGALADGTANPTDALFGSLNFLYNGTTWDRWRSVGTGIAKTDLSTVGGTATLTGGVNGSQGVGGLAASGASVSGNPLRVGGAFNTTQPTVTNGQAVDFQATARGAQIVATGVDTFSVSAAQSGAWTAAQSGIWTVQPGNSANTTPWLVQPAPGTASGCTPYHLPNGSGATNNSTSIKGSAGNLCDIVPINTTSTTYFLKIYDSATAPTCSSATNLKHIYPVPNAAGAGAGFIRTSPLGESYANGIGFCLTGGGADTDNTNAAAGVYIEASYK